MTLTRKATILYSLLIFASGSAVGAITHRLYMVKSVSAVSANGPDEWRKKYMAEMQGRLKLSGDQVLRLNILLDETRSRVRETQAKVRPEIDQIKLEQRAKVKAMLNGDQQTEYQKMLEERDRAERESKNGPGL